MENLTEAEKAQLLIDINLYYDICPDTAKNHIKLNMEGFTAGWICRAAFEKKKKAQISIDWN